MSDRDDVILNTLSMKRLIKKDVRMLVDKNLAFSDKKIIAIDGDAVPCLSLNGLKKT